MIPSLANDIWTILVATCGAREDGRAIFEQYLVAHGNDGEFRFQGSLGFGGKFYCKGWRVSYYPEDHTPAREAAVNMAMVKLTMLRDRAGRVLSAP